MANDQTPEPYADWAEREYEAARRLASRRPFFFAGVILLIVVIGGFYIANDNLRDDIRIRDGRIQDLQFEVLKQQDIATKAVGELAPFKALAAKVYTNELPSDQLNRLWQDIQPDQFSVALNGVLLTNNWQGRSLLPNPQRVWIGSNTTLKISVTNDGRLPLVRTTVAVAGMWTESTNIKWSFGWGKGGSYGLTTTTGEEVDFPMRVATSQNSIPARSKFVVPQIEILGAIPPMKNPETFIHVHSDRSEPRIFHVAIEYSK